MSEFALASVPLRQNAPVPICWFEFLLSPNLLEEHLKKEKPEPSATELIIKFLANASLPKDREQTTFPPVTVLPSEKFDSVESVEEVKEPVRATDNKKETALKLLAHKVAAFLKWNLNVIQSKLPLPMQNTLLNNLLFQALEGEPFHAHPKYHLERLDAPMDVLSDQAFFAINLFHRWCARTILSDSFTLRPPKIPPVSIPEHQDPTFVAPAVIESLIKTIYEWLVDTKLILEKCLNFQRDIHIPSFETFDTLSEDKNKVEYFWDRGLLVENKEIICQTAYDLGCLHFYQREYSQAGELFFKAYELYEDTPKPVFCCIDYDTLKGYCVALGGILQKPIISTKPSLIEHLQTDSKNNFENIIPILMEDNEKCEIPLVYREQIATNLSCNHPVQISLEVQFQICTLNVIRWVMLGRPIVHDYVSSLLACGEMGAKFLHDAVENVYFHLDTTQKQNLANFLRYICKATLTINPLISKILNELRMFGVALCPIEEIEKSGSKLPLAIPKRDFSGHSGLQLGELEMQLQITYDPQVVWELIPRLHALGLRRPAWLITKRWELVNPLHTLIIELPQGYVQEATYVLAAKIRELTRLKSYREARRILEAVEREVSDKSFKMLRLISWEILLLDLLQVRSLSLQRPPSENWIKELIKQTKACLTFCLQEQAMEILPRSEIVEECALFLLHSQQWDYLIPLVIDRGSCLEFPVILARACNEIRSNKNARKAARELWDVVLPMFALSTGQQKRGVGGLPTLVQREMPYVIMPRNHFNRYFTKIKDGTILSILISLLSKIHNILKDDANNNITIENASMWPSVISNSSAFGIKLVHESLTLLLNHALSLYPTSLTWLKAKAELNYVMGHHADALRCYLESAVLSSDYFSNPISRLALDDASLRRTIRCCCQLQCHTQAAVLCQFLDEVDYTMAFKCLQEKTGQDAMDAYYDCIWDLNMLEFLVHIHTKRGEVTKKELALKLIGQLELNANNNADIQREAIGIRKSRFLRAMVKQFL